MPIKSITSPWRCQLVTCMSAVSRLASRVNRSGAHCTDEVLTLGVIVIVSAATLAEPLTLAHHKFRDALPFSSISIIGMRLEPGRGGESKNSALPKGNAGSFAAAEISETAKMATATQQAECQRSWNIVFPGKVSEAVRGLALGKDTLGKDTWQRYSARMKPQRDRRRQVNWQALVEIG